MSDYKYIYTGNTVISVFQGDFSESTQIYDIKFRIQSSSLYQNVFG